MKNKLSRAVSKSRTQFWPKITPDHKIIYSVIGCDQQYQILFQDL